MKRDGRLVGFKKAKITNAIFSAAQAVGGKDRKTAEKLSDMVVKELNKKFTKVIPSIEYVQDIVENTLIKESHAKTAKVYIIYREKRKLLRDYMEGIVGKRTKSNLSANAMMILKEKFLRRDELGNILETPDEMFRRVAKDIAKADSRYKGDVKKTEEEFFEMLENLDFLPNTPCLMNAGTKMQQLVSSFVLPVPDTIEGIFESVKHSALINKAGAGAGFSFSSLRPENDAVVKTCGLSSGPISFIKMFDRTTQTIKEGGRKRGANIAVLRYDHPDILKFITAKDDENQYQNFNFSVGITDKFISIYKRNGKYPLVNPRKGQEVREIKAREMLDLLAIHAWENGDPGVVFLDRMNRDNPTPTLGKFLTTDPCGSIPLLPYESCPQGAINLVNMIKNNNIDYKKLKDIVWKSVHFLDNVIDMNNYPVELIDEISKGNRKIGLGVMGFADMLYNLKIPYDSDESVEIAEKIMEFIEKEARDASIKLAKERGVFPYFDKSVYYKKNIKIRNATRTSISPTGTTSIIANVSPSIEPNFALCYSMRLMGKDFLFVNKFFEKTARENNFYSELFLEDLRNKASISKIEDIPQKVRRVHVLAHDIKPKWHLKVQAAFQKHINNSVSKTINFPANATVEDIKKVFLMAYELDCKGITVYREGSKKKEIMTLVD